VSLASGNLLVSSLRKFEAAFPPEPGQRSLPGFVVEAATANDFFDRRSFTFSSDAVTDPGLLS
jgi:hypothetical protein